MAHVFLSKHLFPLVLTSLLLLKPSVAYAVDEDNPFNPVRQLPNPEASRRLPPDTRPRVMPGGSRVRFPLHPYSDQVYVKMLYPGDHLTAPTGFTIISVNIDLDPPPDVIQARRGKIGPFPVGQLLYSALGGTELK